MDKAVLMIDMPKTCYDCPLSNYGNCIIVGDIDEDLFNDTRDSNCPLKSLPEKCDIEKLAYPEDDAEFMSGWNACIDELTDFKSSSEGSWEELQKDAEQWRSHWLWTEEGWK